MMVGVMDKIGTFGMIRFCLGRLPRGEPVGHPGRHRAGRHLDPVRRDPAIGSKDIMRLIAFTSISHFGFIVLGIFAFTSQSMVGSTLYMLNHGLSTAALFLVAGYLIKRRGARTVDDFGGVAKVAPVLAGLLLFAGLSTLSLPGLSSFVSEFMVLAGTFSRYTAVAVISTLAIVLAALYILIMYQSTMTGPVTPDVEQSVTRPEWPRAGGDGPAGAAHPGPRLLPEADAGCDHPSIAATMQHVGVTDPQPTVSSAEGADDDLHSLTRINPPTIEYGLLAPFILIFAAACIGVGVEAFAPRSIRRPIQLVLTFGSIVLALLVVVPELGQRHRRGDHRRRLGSDRRADVLHLDDPAGARRDLAAGVRRTQLDGGRACSPRRPAAVPGTAAEQEALAARVEHTEVFPLALFALSGMMFFPASNDLITMFVALEILSLPLYLLCGMARRRRLLSQEAAMKYFLLGALSSAFFVYGAALLYGYTGSFDLAAIDAAIQVGTQGYGLLLAGMALIGVGLLFKFGAVPVPRLDPGRLHRRPDTGHRLHGGLHQDRRDRRTDAGVLRRHSAAPAGTGSR